MNRDDWTTLNPGTRLGNHPDDPVELPPAGAYEALLQKSGDTGLVVSGEGATELFGAPNLDGSIVVAGLGRCGTSAVMAMLQAGGVACFGERPSFEPYNQSLDTPLVPEGRATKVIDPHLARLLPTRAPKVVIFLTRNHRQQATSMARMAAHVTGRPWPRKARKRLEKDLPGNERAARRALRSWVSVDGVAPVMVQWTFEQVLRDPRATAQMLRDAATIAGYTPDLPRSLGGRFRTDLARRVVHPRMPQARLKPWELSQGLLGGGMVEDMSFAEHWVGETP